MRSAAGKRAGRSPSLPTKDRPPGRAARVNQRVATVAASTMAVSPVPMPTTRPQSTMSCHTCVMASDASSPPAISTAAQIMTRRKPEAVHERRRERAEQSEQQEAQRQRRRDLRIVPAELALQRNDQHARRAHGAGRHQHGQEGDADHDPAVVDMAAGEKGGERG